MRFLASLVLDGALYLKSNQEGQSFLLEQQHIRGTAERLDVVPQGHHRSHLWVTTKELTPTMRRVTADAINKMPTTLVSDTVMLPFAQDEDQIERNLFVICSVGSSGSKVGRSRGNE